MNDQQVATSLTRDLLQHVNQEVLLCLESALALCWHGNCNFASCSACSVKLQIKRILHPGIGWSYDSHMHPVLSCAILCLAIPRHIISRGAGLAHNARIPDLLHQHRLSRVFCPFLGSDVARSELSCPSAEAQSVEFPVFLCVPWQNLEIIASWSWNLG